MLSDLLPKLLMSDSAHVAESLNQSGDGLYFSDYVAFCEDARGRIPPPGAADAPLEFDRIAASGVTFTYPGADEPSLREVSVEIGRGEVVALVGENGSGKTTLAKILAGPNRPQAGTVYWDDVSIAEVTGDKDGAELSGGQWQRIAAARGFYRTAPLLIMDEPTAALDARAEYALFTSLRTLARDRTVLIITHRLASVRHADRIYVLAHGKVAETGTHAELMALGGQYADLYTLQASQYDTSA
jgi:ATP-binding cassette subfamily B protein